MTQNSLHLSRALPLAIALFACGLGAASAQQARLKAVSTVETDIVRLGDLIENAGRSADVVVFGAPQPGQSGAISAARVLLAARDHGIGDIDTAGLSSVAVRRVGRTITSDDMRRTIAAALAREHGTPADAELELSVGGTDTTIESVATEPLAIRHLHLNSASSRFEATLTVAGSRQLELQPIRIVGTIADVVRVPVLTKAILKGDVVTAADITMERRRRSDMTPDLISDLDKVVGNAARRALPRGTLLREADIQRPELVERNGAVVMTFEQPGVQLAMRGRALSAGAMGDVIQVQNINSRRVVEAKVTGPGRVAVTGVVLPEKPVRNASNAN